MAWQRTGTRFVCADPGGSPAALSLRSGGIRGDAGSYSSAAQRARAGHAFDGDAGTEAAVCASAVAKEKAERRARGIVATARAAGVAAALLRFQCLGPTQAGGEAAVYASESGEARAGAGPGTVGVEPLSHVRVWRTGRGEDQSVACGGDEDSDLGLDTRSTGTNPRMPTHCKRRKGWATQTAWRRKGRGTRRQLPISPVPAPQ
jgi:hypothetical protein